MRVADTVSKNHRRFLERAISEGTVWYLATPEGGVTTLVSDEDDTVSVYPFWSDASYARRAAKASLPGTEPTPVAFADFLRAWLPGMSDDGHRVGPNWTGDLVGWEVQPNTLGVELLDTMTVEQRCDLAAHDLTTMSHWSALQVLSHAGMNEQVWLLQGEEGAVFQPSQVGEDALVLLTFARESDAQAWIDQPEWGDHVPRPLSLDPWLAFLADLEEAGHRVGLGWISGFGGQEEAAGAVIHRVQSLFEST
jgi:hypothetical protein